MIQPPGWAKHAVPKPNGWHDPRTDELLKSVRLSTDQINEYNGITSEPEVLTEVPEVDPMMHTHDDGLTHSHPGGDEPHEHHDESSDLDNMSKRELEALGREHGIELDRRKNKQDLIEELSAHMNN